MLKRWSGNIYSTSESNYQTFNKIHAKIVLAAMLEDKSMPSNMAAFKRYVNFWHQQDSNHEEPQAVKFLSRNLIS